MNQSPPNYHYYNIKKENRPAQVFSQVPHGTYLGDHLVSGKYLELYRSALGGAPVLGWWQVADVEGTKDGCGLQLTINFHELPWLA